MLKRDTSCPNGGVFYSCNKGFVGCCLVEACNPGVGCPPDKDTTSNKHTSLNMPTSTRTSAPTPSTSTTSIASPSTVTTSKLVLASSIASSTTQAIIAGSSSTAASDEQNQHDGGNAVPAAALVGAVLGGIILIAVVIGLFYCIRRHRYTKVYKAAVYPSPHVGNDMSPQLPEYEESKVSRFASLMETKQKFAHHLDSREVVPATEMGEATPRHLAYAELPGSSRSIRNV
ncbi:hypothetical protein EKO04_002627 [Ascochyta lentis]|uniref:Uncharacterized protein n=1 Tax=Ascochyta lentis TaxID=205686 RepID=A0A8H7JAT0_9PLEO|nr:hypothetical protein EKO04_002627 [Ascochyta lentis]